MAGLTQQVVTTGRWEDAGEIPAGRSTAADPCRAAPYDGSEQRLARLVRTIEVEVIPRLVLARRAAGDAPPVAANGHAAPGCEDVAELAALALARDGSVASSYVAALRTRGMSVETLYLDLLAPAARHLGELWDEDRCSFSEVTLGLWRLHQVLRELSPAFQNVVEHRAHGLRALLAPAPGEQHTFGLSMVAEFFRRAGWDVWSGPVTSRQELVAMVGGEWFAVVGLSVSSERKLEEVAAGIRAIRRASRNRAIGVMVGGPVFLDHPDLVARVGADATAVDGRQAARQAHDLLTLLARHR
jgi:methanogenic corrinoid protein MtbC1